MKTKIYKNRQVLQGKTFLVKLNSRPYYFQIKNVSNKEIKIVYHMKFSEINFSIPSTIEGIVKKVILENTSDRVETFDRRIFKSAVKLKKVRIIIDGVRFRLNNITHTYLDLEKVIELDELLESDDESIATIDASGYVLGLKKGTINISVTWKKDPTVKGSSTIAITSMDAEKYDSLNGIIRKLIGHFGAFLVTGVFGILTAYFFFFKGKMKYISLAIFLVYGLLLAILSEVLQIFAGSRTPAWSDVGIDFSGYAIGAIVTFGILLLIYVKTKRKEISTQE